MDRDEDRPEPGGTQKGELACSRRGYPSAHRSEEAQNCPEARASLKLAAASPANSAARPFVQYVPRHLIVHVPPSDLEADACVDRQDRRVHFGVIRADHGRLRVHLMHLAQHRRLQRTTNPAPPPRACDGC